MGSVQLYQTYRADFNHLKVEFLEVPVIDFLDSEMMKGCLKLETNQ